jgi:ATP-binding cassette subfamily F protein 3
LNDPVSGVRIENVNRGAKDVLRIVKKLTDDIVKREPHPPGAHAAFSCGKTVERVFHSASFVLDYAESQKKSRTSPCGQRIETIRMSLVAVLNLSLSFVGREILREANFQVEPGDRIGLVGPNGSGKTSLLRMIVGELQPDKGEIRIAKGARLGYLPQDIYEVLSGGLLQFVVDSVPSRVPLKEQLAALESSLGDHPDPQTQSRLAAQLAEVHHKIIDLDAHHPLHLAEKILLGLGFKPEDFPKAVGSLSGGWKMRAALASLLYQSPDLLLLDEPTNHLDVPSVHWLKEFLRTYKGGMILICHDREFLNRHSERTISFEPEGMKFYNGNYEHYLKAREEETRVLEARAKHQERKVKEAERFIERFRAKASKARQAQSKIKLVKKIELVETFQKRKTIRFSFPPVPRSGREVVSLQGLSKSFGSLILYEDLNLRVMRGERVAIVGPNGAGKTTLLRLIAGEILPDRGQAALGHNVTMSYYAQHLSEMLDPNKTILAEVYQVVPHESVSFVRGVCGAFLFSGPDVDKAVGILSGGERARVSLAKILVKPGNLIIMDEPTNHLDIISSEMLIDALQDFEGTLLFVSHNLSFVNRLATKIWDIRDNAIVEYPGTLQEYFDHLAGKEAELQVEEARQGQGQEDNTASRQKRKTLRREKAEKRSSIAAALKPIQTKLKQLEERIDVMEKRKTELEQFLADPELFKDKSKSVPLLNEYGDLRKKLDELMGRWEYQQEQLEAVKRELGIKNQ